MKKTKKTLNMEELIEMLQDVSQVKNLSEEVVIQSLKDALISAARKYLDLQKVIEVQIDAESNEIRVSLNVEVVDDYPDVPEDATAEEVQEIDEHYMLLDEAREYNEDAEVGDILEMDIPIEGFGRMAIQTAKQFLMQRVREAERKRIFDDYQDRVGTLISGTVQQVDRGNILVNLGKAEAILPLREQIRKERYRQGDSIQALILDVSDSAKGAQVVLSRGHADFLAELFKLEVPEIYDGIVEIRGVVRDPGFRAKIAVFSKDNRIDPVGSCVGMKGNRVQSIVRELSNERIDIINWTEDLHTYIRRSLSPANILKLIEVPGMSRIVTLVDDEDLSQAIGRNGQNVKLASQLVGREIDIYGEKEYSAFSDEDRNAILNPRENDRPLHEVNPDTGDSSISKLEDLFKQPQN